MRRKPEKSPADIADAFLDLWEENLRIIAAKGPAASSK